MAILDSDNRDKMLAEGAISMALTLENIVLIFFSAAAVWACEQVSIFTIKSFVVFFKKCIALGQKSTFFLRASKKKVTCIPFQNRTLCNLKVFPPKIWGPEKKNWQF